MHLLSLRWSAAGLLALSCFLGAGCGTGKATVTGKVSASGKTVVWGAVTLVDRTGLYHQADIALDGTYRLTGVHIGSVQIAVVSPNPDRVRGRPAGRAVSSGGKGNDPREKFLRDKGIQPNTDERPRPPEGAWFPLDRRFADPSTSGLTGEVRSGTTTLDITIP